MKTSDPGYYKWTQWIFTKLYEKGLAYEAEVLVIAIDNKEAATELARYMHETHPKVHVVARAIDRWHVYDLWAAGCRDIIRETYDSSIRAARSVFEAIGYSRPDAEKLIAVFEAQDRKTMLESAEAFIESDPESEQRRQQPRRARLRRQTVDGQHPQARQVG